MSIARANIAFIIYYIHSVWREKEVEIVYDEEITRLPGLVGHLKGLSGLMLCQIRD